MPGFKIIRPLGKGSMGEAFLASDPSHEEKLFVLKQVSKDTFTEKIELLRREFATLIRLSHPNITRVFKFGEESHSYFFLEEYVDGGDLFQATAQANYNQILAALAQVLRALIYLHHQGLIHGDLKAENILVVRNASLFSPDSVKLIDFGLSRTRREVSVESLPSGSLFFMAPEILLERPYDHRADLYALGVTLYRMLTGQYPFEQENGNLARLVQAQIGEIPVEPKRFQRDMPKGLNEITMKLLAKSPDERFQNASEVLAELNTLEGENFPLWTERELQQALHDGPFLDREEEIRSLWAYYRSGRREFHLWGEEGIGKKSLEREFRYQLQMAGEDDDAIQIRIGKEATATEGTVALLPWDHLQVETFLKDRFRSEEIPKDLGKILFDLSKGNPERLILLLEFCFSEGMIQIQGDKVEFKPTLTKRLPAFESILKKKAVSLQKEKQEILRLCAFSRQPLSPEILSRITGISPALLEGVLESLEKEHWVQRVLHQGIFQYQARGEATQSLLQHLSEGKSFDSLLKLVEETYRSGRHLQAHHLLESLLRSSTLEMEKLNRDQKIQFFGTASILSLETGELEKARFFCEKFLEVPKLPPYEMGRILNRLGWIEYRKGKYPEALKVFERAEEQWDKTQDASGKASVANFQATAHQALGDHPRAQTLYRKALKVLKKGDPWGPLIRTNLAASLQESEEFEGALKEYETARQESERGSDPFLKTRLLNTLANLYLYLGQLSEARNLAHESLRLSLENGLSLLEGQNYLLLSIIADREGNLDDHRQFIEKAATLFEKHGAAAEKARAKLHQAYYYFTTGEDQRAQEILTEIRRSFPQETTISIQCDLLSGKMEARKESPDLSKGLPFLKKALEFFEDKNDRANLWEVCGALGELLRVKDPSESRRNYQKALNILEELARRVPQKFKGSFFRDRKRERILSDLESLGGFPEESQESNSEGQSMKTSAFTETARITRLLASGHNLNFLLETILEESLDLIQGERGFILLFEEGEFRVKALRNMERKVLEGEEKGYSKTIARQAALKGESVLAKNAMADERFREAESVMGLGIRAAVAVPMKIGPETLGVIYLDNRFRGEGFDEGHQKLLEVFADQAALAIRNARQTEEIQANQKKLASSMEQIEELNRLLQERLEKREMEFGDLKEKFEAQQGELSLRFSYDQIIGESAKLKGILKVLDRVTDSDATVLITGESGTGKELIARALHFNSPRKKAPFLAENCSAFSETLLESELFGHMRGSFTGALNDRKGIFEVAKGGTVFLDEMGEMPLSMQPKLLRVLQERQVRPLGGKDYQKVDIRLVAATNKNLEELVEAGKFREDLFYRINVIRIQLPSLRERREDIPLLVEHFLKDNVAKLGKQIKISPKAIDLLIRYDWPGNIRELANEIQKCCALGPKMITPDLLSDHIRLRPANALRLGSLDENLKNTEKLLILEALKSSHFSKVQAAEILGISRITLYKKMKAYKIQLKEMAPE